MHPITTDFDQERIASLARLATALEQADEGRLRLTPAAYRSLSRQLAGALRRHEGEPAALQALLAAHPAAAELYENLHYDVAGLVRSPIDMAAQGERQAAALIARVRG